jgi:hypothetical protein
MIGCDSIGVLRLVITSNITVSDTVKACGLYTWNGNTYNYSGVYTIIASSNVGCDTTKILHLTIIPAPIAAVSALPILCHGESTFAVVTATGGLPPYSGTGAFIVYAGTYNYVVSDASGCSSTASITLIDPPALTDYINVTASGTGTSNGTASVVVSGGTYPYYYSWSNGSISDTANSLPSGIIKLYVTDRNGCQIADSAVVPESLISCSGFVTYPTSSWASSIAGLYARQHFTDYFKFSDYLAVGCIAGGRIRFSNYEAVRNALMANGAPWPLALGTDLLNPDTLQVSNILAAEIMALTLNMVSDSADEHFSPATPLLSRLTVARGPLVGKSVRFVLDQANQFLGGCTSTYSGAQLLEAVRAINLNFEDGRRDLGFLYCQPSDPEPDMNTIRFNGGVSIYPNPSYGPFVVRFDIKEPSNVRVSLFDAKGALVYDHNAGFLSQGYQSILIGGSPRLASGIYMLKLVIGESVKTYKVMVGK